MKKLFSVLCFLFAFTAVALCQSTGTTIDTGTLIGIGGTIIGTLVGHFGIPSKWASPIKYVLLVSKGITWILEKVNNTNTGEPKKAKAQDVQPPVQPPTAPKK